MQVNCCPMQVELEGCLWFGKDNSIRESPNPHLVNTKVCLSGILESNVILNRMVARGKNLI